MNDLSRRNFVGLGVAFAAGGALAQGQLTKLGGAKPIEKEKGKFPAHITKSDSWKDLDPEIKAFLLENGVYTRSSTRIASILSEKLYSGSYKGASVLISFINFTKIKGDEISLRMDSISEQVLLGEPSGFDYTVPEGFGFHLTDEQVKLMAKLPADEREKIGLIIEVVNEGLWCFLRFPICIPDEAELAKGSVINGRVCRIPVIAGEREAEAWLFKGNEKNPKGGLRPKDETEWLFRPGNVAVSPQKRSLYNVFGYPTSSEELTKIGSPRQGNASACASPVVNPNRFISIRSTLAEYPPGDKLGPGRYGTGHIYKWLVEFNKYRRFQSVQGYEKTIKEIMAGKYSAHGTVGKRLAENGAFTITVSPNGKKILEALRKYVADEGKKIGAMQADDPALQPNKDGEEGFWESENE